MQGRVFAVVMSLCNAVTPSSMVIAGPVADALGVRPLYVIAGVSQVVIGLGAFLVPTIMHLEEGSGPQHGTAEAVTLAGAVLTGAGAE